MSDFKDPFYPRAKRHVRGKKTGFNKRGVKLHPALIVGEETKSFYSMGMTTAKPKNHKEKKKYIQLAEKSRKGQPSYLKKTVEGPNPKSMYSPEKYPEYSFTEDEQKKIDSAVGKKREWMKKSSRCQSKGEAQEQQCVGTTKKIAHNQSYVKNEPRKGGR